MSGRRRSEATKETKARSNLAVRLDGIVRVHCEQTGIPCHHNTLHFGSYSDTGRRGKLSIPSRIRHQETALSVHSSRIGVTTSGSSKLLADNMTRPGNPSPVQYTGVPQLGQKTLSILFPLSATFEYVAIAPDDNRKLDWSTSTAT